MPVTTMAVRSGPARALSTDRARNWRDAAACTTEDPELFAPEISDDDSEDGAERFAAALEQARRARRVCLSSCPVIDQCGQWAAEQGITSGVWGGVWLDEEQRKAEAHRRETERERRAAETLRMIAYQHEATNLALAYGTDIILARLAGQEAEEIADWAGSSVLAARRALLILLPPDGDRRIDVSPLERILRQGDRLSILIARGRTDAGIARIMRTRPHVVEQARQILQHRAAARQAHHDHEKGITAA